MVNNSVGVDWCGNKDNSTVEMSMDICLSPNFGHVGALLCS